MNNQYYINTVTFTGKPECIAAIKFLIEETFAGCPEELTSQHLVINNPALPDQAIPKDSSASVLIISFTTRFSPNEELLVNVSKNYSVNIYQEYFNRDLLSYGVNIWVAGELFEFTMEEEDFLLYDIYSNGKFIFEKKTYDDRLDIFKIILSRKIANHKPSLPTMPAKFA